MRFDDVMAVLTALHDENVEYVLLGGVAVGLHGLERATSDIDLFVRPSQENIERLRGALRRVFDAPSIDEITAEDLASEYPTVRYGPPEADYLIDILGRLGSVNELAPRCESAAIASRRFAGISSGALDTKSPMAVISASRFAMSR